MLPAKRLTTLAAPLKHASGAKSRGLAVLARRPVLPLSLRASTPSPSHFPSHFPTSSPLRSFSSTSRASQQPLPPASEPTITEEEYEHISEADMDKMHENLEALCEQFGPEDWEVEYSSGVMTLSVPPTGTYVINKQPPNLQIWMSSPVSGPSRFEYVDGVWVHHRQAGVKLGELLDVELRGILKESGRDGEGWSGVGLP
ncbi:iron donor protein CyaY [Cryptococcus sp. DSM 104549]